MFAGWFFFFFSSRRRHTRCALVTGVQTCALPISDRRGNGRSLGPRSPETEVLFGQYRADKRALTERAAASAAKLDETCRLYREIGRASCRERVCQYV